MFRLPEKVKIHFLDKLKIVPVFKTGTVYELFSQRFKGRVGDIMVFVILNVNET